jgi:predicted component of type VI protein secretion system
LDEIHIPSSKEAVMKFFEWIQNLFASKKEAPARGTQAEKSEMIQKVLAMLSETREDELTCDQVLAVLDQFAELAARGEDVSKLMPLVQHHLQMCADCMEEYRVLERIITSAE